MEKKVYSGDNDFKIYAMKVNAITYPELQLNRYGNISIMGNMVDLDPDVEYEIVAEKKDTKYGISYIVKSIRRDIPTSKEDVYAFLSTVLTYNQAEVLYSVYPDIIERIKENKPIDLSKTKGIKDKSFEKVKKKVIENFSLFDVIAKFKNVFSYNTMQKLYEKYGSAELIEKKICENPYECLCAISRIGFLKADEMILKIEAESKKLIANGDKPILNFEYDIRTSKQRCLFCVIYLLEKNEENGNTYMSISNLKDEVMALANDCFDNFVDCINDDRIFYDRDKLIIALNNTYKCERYIADTIINALDYNNEYIVNDLNKYRSIDGVLLSDEQFSTLKMICKKNIVILNGYAGSGKSFTTTAILNMLDDIGKTYMLFAPTGKAAKVLKEYTKRESFTIHKGLGCTGVGTWAYNENNKINTDIVLIDEFSMVDVSLCVHLFNAIDFTKTKLLIIGDSAQLPSVGCGNILHDLLCSSIVPRVTLHHIFRYNEGGLMTVATDIRHCKKYLKTKSGSCMNKFGNGDYIFFNIEQDKSIKLLIDIYRKLIQNNPVSDIQVLSAQKIGEYGSNVLNKYLQAIVNPNIKNTLPISIGEKNYYIGDVIIQTVNNYKATVLDQYTNENEPKMCFIANGEVGTIENINGSYTIINFDGVKVVYSKDAMQNVDLGYCMTVHKSQGSSSKYVIFISPKAHTFMLNSNLMYVAVTRTKQKCIHIGLANTVNYCVTKKEDYSRNTMLGEIINNNN